MKPKQKLTTGRVFYILAMIVSFSSATYAFDCFYPSCAAPPVGCHYTNQQVDANGCPMGCGELVGDNGGTCNPEEVFVCQMPSCAAPPIGCHYTNPQIDANGCPMGCGELVGENGDACNPEEVFVCQMPSCAPPPVGCHYTNQQVDANGCPMGCGELVGENGSVCNPGGPVDCLIPPCAAPPMGCHYSNIPHDSNNCPIGCGVLVSDNGGECLIPFEGFCGDGIIDPSEICDTALSNNPHQISCENNCKTQYICGENGQGGGGFYYIDPNYPTQIVNGCCPGLTASSPSSEFWECTSTGCELAGIISDMGYTCLDQASILPDISVNFVEHQNPTQYTLNDMLQYTIRISNNGHADANSVIVRNQNDQIVFNGSIPKGYSYTRNYSSEPLSSVFHEERVTASVGPNQADRSLSNNSDMITLTQITPITYLRVNQVYEPYRYGLQGTMNGSLFIPQTEQIRKLSLSRGDNAVNQNLVMRLQKSDAGCFMKQPHEDLPVQTNKASDLDGAAFWYSNDNGSTWNYQPQWQNSTMISNVVYDCSITNIKILFGKDKIYNNVLSYSKLYGVNNQAITPDANMQTCEKAVLTADGDIQYSEANICEQLVNNKQQNLILRGTYPISNSLYTNFQNPVIFVTTGPQYVEFINTFSVVNAPVNNLIYNVHRASGCFARYGSHTTQELKARYPGLDIVYSHNTGADWSYQPQWTTLGSGSYDCGITSIQYRMPANTAINENIELFHSKYYPLGSVVNHDTGTPGFDPIPYTCDKVLLSADGNIQYEESTSCMYVTYCGNGMIDGKYETCDEGNMNGTIGHCSATCNTPPSLVFNNNGCKVREQAEKYGKKISISEGCNSFNGLTYLDNNNNMQLDECMIEPQFPYNYVNCDQVRQTEYEPTIGTYYDTATHISYFGTGTFTFKSSILRDLELLVQGYSIASGNMQTTITATGTPNAYHTELWYQKSQQTMITAENLSDISTVAGSSNVLASQFKLLTSATGGVSYSKFVLAGNIEFNASHISKATLYKGTYPNGTLIAESSVWSGSELILNISGSSLSIPNMSTQPMYITVDTITGSYPPVSVYIKSATAKSLSNAPTVIQGLPADSTRAITVTNGSGSLYASLNTIDSKVNRPKVVLGGTTSPEVAAIELNVSNDSALLKNMRFVVSGSNINGSINNAMLISATGAVIDGTAEMIGSNTIVFNNIDTQLPMGTTKIYLKVVTNQIGNNGATEAITPFQIKLDGVDVEWNANGSRVSYAGPTLYSHPFSIKEVKISTIAITAAGNSIPAYSVNKRVAGFTFTADSSSNTTPAGFALKAKIDMLKITFGGNLAPAVTSAKIKDSVGNVLGLCTIASNIATCNAIANALIDQGGSNTFYLYIDTSTAGYSPQINTLTIALNNINTDIGVSSADSNGVTISGPYTELGLTPITSIITISEAGGGGTTSTSSSTTVGGSSSSTSTTSTAGSASSSSTTTAGSTSAGGTTVIMLDTAFGGTTAGTSAGSSSSSSTTTVGSTTATPGGTSSTTPSMTGSVGTTGSTNNGGSATTATSMTSGTSSTTSSNTGSTTSNPATSPTSSGSTTTGSSNQTGSATPSTTGGTSTTSTTGTPSAPQFTSHGGGGGGGGSSASSTALSNTIIADTGATQKVFTEPKNQPTLLQSGANNTGSLVSTLLCQNAEAMSERYATLTNETGSLSQKLGTTLTNTLDMYMDRYKQNRLFQFLWMQQLICGIEVLETKYPQKEILSTIKDYLLLLHFQQ